MKFWNPFTWFSGDKPMSTDFIPIHGTITKYGYRGDSTPDTNSANGIGAWDNALRPDVSFAASPDVEAALRAAGIKPKSTVEIQLREGTVLQLNWGDRTASDQVAAHLGLHPLRGRFDLYTPSDRCPYDGRAVTGFRPAPTLPEK